MKGAVQSHAIKQRWKILVYKLHLTQFVTVGLISILFGLFDHSKTQAASICLGGLTWLLATSGFAGQFLRRFEARAARTILRDFALGEIIRWVILCFCAILLFKLTCTRVLFFILGMVAAQISALAVLGWVR